MPDPRNTALTTEQRAALLDALQGGMTIADACDAASVSRYRLYRDRQANTAFDRACRQALKRRNELVEDALFERALNGDVHAQKFWLANRDPSRWQKARQTERKDTLQVTLKDIVEQCARQQKKDA